MARWCTVATLCAASVLIGPHLRPAGAQSPPGSEPALVSIKLSASAGARLREGRIVDRTGRPLVGLQRLLEETAAPTAPKSRAIRPLFPLSRRELARLRAEAVAGWPGTGPDLESWVRVTVRPALDLTAVLGRLNGRPDVDTAYVAPVPAPPPGLGLAHPPARGARSSETPRLGAPTGSPDLTQEQSYFGPAPLGIDARYAREHPGGDGRGVRIVEIESDWVLEHEDLGLPDAARLRATECRGVGGPCFADHGTSVLGVLAARPNGYGITGGVPAAEVRVLSSRFEGRYDPAAALALAAGGTRPGDVVLIELQAVGPEDRDRYVPVEWIPEVRDAIEALTRAGRIVIEPAGNGAVDLDGAAYEGRFDRARYDSGAILVGGGDTTRAPLAVSNHGTRLDLQGWGCCVTTTGAGNETLSREILARSYRRDFGGTSSAAAMVAVAAASLQGVALDLHGTPLTPRQIVSLLRDTGTPQRGAASRRIGPLPDLRNAIERFATFESLISEGDAVEDLLRGGRLTESHRRHLDLLGNGDGTFDAGDVAALLDRRRSPGSEP